MAVSKKNGAASNHSKKDSRHVAIYIRVSTDTQAEEGYSIDAQKEQLTAYCVAKGWKNYQLYVDAGYSGSTLERPAIQRLIKDASEDRVSNCLVFKLDRLSRSQKDTLYLIEDVFNLHQVGFISLNESMDTTTPMGRLMIGILSAFAQLERENIRLRTRMGMKERVKSGLWMGGGRVPFGYDYDPSQGILVPNQDAKTVEKIYDLYIQGYSPQRIANMVGLKYDKLVVQILTRKINYGVIEYNGEEYLGKHQSLVTKEIYDKAMNIMKRRSADNVKAANHLLTGLVYCGHCGAKMRYIKWGKNGYKFFCYSQQSTKKYLVKDKNCPQEKVWAEDVEEVVIADVKRFALKYQNLDSEEICTSVVQTLIQRESELKKRIKNLFNLYSDSADELLLETINENKAELEKITFEIEKEKKEKAELSSRIALKETLKNLSELWEYMSFHERQNIIRSVVDKIVVTDYKIAVSYKI